MNLEHLNSLYSLVKTPKLSGRYITNSHIENCFSEFSDNIISIIGYSVEKRPIYKFQFGHGPIKILLWSQMHGNESTTTKSLFDCFRLFETNNTIPKTILDACTLTVIPILNPDGAKRYTRLNANSIDLNRDAQELSQPESGILRTLFEEVRPDYCFNLHGQRTIFGAGNTANSAILSFLSPSQDVQRSLSTNRKISMAIIAEINSLLQKEIPNSIGRYDDDFNLNCVGDTFQSSGVPTLLYEAGHFPNDYNREEVRRLVFISILKGLTVIANGIDVSRHEDYFQIPENSKCFYDIVIRNAKLSDENGSLTDIAIQHKEELTYDKIEFVPTIEVISDLKDFFGHIEIDARGELVRGEKKSRIKVTDENDFVVLNNKKIALKP